MTVHVPEVVICNQSLCGCHLCRGQAACLTDKSKCYLPSQKVVLLTSMSALTGEDKDSSDLAQIALSSKTSLTSAHSLPCYTEWHNMYNEGFHAVVPCSCWHAFMSRVHLSRFQNRQLARVSRKKRDPTCANSSLMASMSPCTRSHLFTQGLQHTKEGVHALQQLVVSPEVCLAPYQLHSILFSSRVIGQRLR